MKKLQGYISPWLVLVAIAVVWRLVYAYWTPAIGHYLAPPGDDGATHIQEISNILSGHGNLIGANGYPHGLHFLLAAIAVVFRMSALSVVVWLTPLLIVLPIVVVYYVGTRFFKSSLAGAVAAAAWGFIALAPVRALGDGNYPNLFAASIILPFAMLALYQFITTPRPAKAILLTIFIILIALVHHLTLIYMVVISVPWLVIIAVEKLWDTHRRKRSLRGALASVMTVVLLGGLFMLFYGKLLKPYLTVIQQGGNLSRYLGGDSSTLSLSQIMEINGPLLILLGLVGLMTLTISSRERYLKLFFASWVLVLLLFGTIPTVGLPGRFVRELAVPFSLLIGFMAQFLYDHTLPRLRNILIPVAVVLLFAVVWVSSFDRPFALPDPYKPIIRVQHEEEPAFELLDDLTPPNNIILANNTDPFLPFLVHRTVQVPSVPADVIEMIKEPTVTTIYIAIAPPLTGDYPFYYHNGEISAALAQIPNLTLRHTLSNGSKIYTRKTSTKK